MLSQPIGTFTTYTTVKKTEVNLDSTAASATAAAVAANGTGYTLDNIGFQITRYDMPQSYFVILIYYPNYSTFLGQGQSLPKGGTTRFNLSTQSLDMVISTFQVQDRDVQQAPILGPHGADGWGSLPSDSSVIGATATANTAGEYGTALKSFNYGLQLGVSKTLNNSK